MSMLSMLGTHPLDPAVHQRERVHDLGVSLSTRSGPSPGCREENESTASPASLPNQLPAGDRANLTVGSISFPSCAGPGLGLEPEGLSKFVNVTTPALAFTFLPLTSTISGTHQQGSAGGGSRGWGGMMWKSHWAWEAGYQGPTPVSATHCCIILVESHPLTFVVSSYP